LEIGDNVIVAPRSGVAKSIPAGQVVSGAPTMPHRLWLKVQQVIPRLPEMHKKVAALARKVERIEKDLKE
jgi:UDP-3-O-[3-hydroxymyristoyl] glucosamine N-acyltransferase